VPKLQNLTLGNTSRLLQSVLEITNTTDIRKDVIDVDIRIKNDQDESMYGYSITIEKWDENSLTLLTVFENPYAISGGSQFDQASIIIKNKTYFRSRETLQTVEVDQLDYIDIPKQLPKGITVAAITAQASSQLGSAMFISIF